MDEDQLILRVAIGAFKGEQLLGTTTSCDRGDTRKPVLLAQVPVEPCQLIGRNVSTLASFARGLKERIVNGNTQTVRRIVLDAVLLDCISEHGRQR